MWIFYTKITSNFYEIATNSGPFVKGRWRETYRVTLSFLIHLLIIYTIEIRHIYFSNFLELVLIIILKLLCTKIDIFNISSGFLYFYTVFNLHSRNVFLMHLDAKGTSCSMILIICLRVYSLYCIITTEYGPSLGPKLVAV
jgi:hypothetical protein